MPDKPWYEDEEFLAGQDSYSPDNAGEIPWYENEEFLRDTSAPSMAEVEESEFGSPVSVAGRQAVESSGAFTRPLIAAPAALISGTERLLTGRGEGFDTYNQEFGKYMRALGSEYAGDPGQDTQAERVGRTFGDVVGTGVESLVTFGGGILAALGRRASSSALQFAERLSFTRGAAETSSLSGQLSTAIKNAPNQVKAIYDEMITNPSRFTAAEITGILGAATGASVAEMIAPGNKGARIGGEVIGGVVSPMAAVSRRAESISGAFSQMFGRFTEAGAEGVVAARLAKGLERAGEDGGRWVERLREYNATVARGEAEETTSGIATGSEYLLALENQAIKRNSAIGVQREQKLREAFKSYDRVVSQMLASGDPQAIRDAAILARAHYEELLETSIGQAQNRALAVLNRFEGNDPASASREVSRILNDSLSQARKAENELWNAVPRDLPMETGNLQRAFDELGVELLPSESLPFQNDISSFISNGANSQDLINLTRSLSSAAKVAARQGDDVTRRRALILKEAAEDSLMNSNVDSRVADNPQYQLAREFSQAIRSRFNDTFAGRAEQDPLDRQSISPERLLDQAFGAARSRNARMRSEAAENLRSMEQASFETSPGRVVSAPAESRQTNWNEWFDTSVLGRETSSYQEEFLRGVVIRDLVDERNGEYVLNANRLEDFRKSNPQIMEEFPILASDLSDLATAQRLVDHEVTAAKATKRELDEMAFSRMTGDLNPEDVVYNIAFTRKNANVQDNMRNLVQVANNAPDPEQAMAGLRSSTLSALFRAAGSREGNNFFANLRQVLDSPIREGGQTNKEMLESLGIIDADYMQRLDRLATLGADTVERASRASSIDLTETEGVRNILEEFAIRLQGAWIGGKAGNITGRPGGLVEAGAGAQAARLLFKRLPGAHAQEIMERAVLEPQYMLRLLEMRAVNNPRLNQQLDAFLISAGYQALSQEDNPEIPSLYDAEDNIYQNDRLFGGQ